VIHFHPPFVTTSVRLEREVEIGLKILLWNFLTQRSAMHRAWSPSCSNTLLSLLMVGLALPIALLTSPYVIFRTLLNRKTILYELRIQGEFGWLVDLLERVRNQHTENHTKCIVFVRASIQHRGLAHLYRKQAGCRILWSSGWTVFLAQVVLLQPLFTQIRKVLSADVVSEFDMSEDVILPTRRLAKCRNFLLDAHGIGKRKYVTMAVFTSSLAEVQDADYQSKYQPRETTGTDLAEGVDFLRSRDIEVVMLGFGDFGKAHVPREMLRLSDFGRIGGHQEVALASGCEYFWSDFVGAQWLREPFKKPVLVTNHDEAWVQKRWNFPSSVLNRYMIVPLRFQTPSGHLLSLREAMAHGPCFQLVADGELIAIRNSPTDIVEAHKEMIDRINGRWRESARATKLHQRVAEIYSEFPEYYVPRLPSSFLERHLSLLD